MAKKATKILAALTNAMVNIKALPAWHVTSNRFEVVRKAYADDMQRIFKDSIGQMIRKLQEKGHVPRNSSELKQLIQILQRQMLEAADLAADMAEQTGKEGAATIAAQLKGKGIELAHNQLPKRAIDVLRERAEAHFSEDIVKNAVEDYRGKLEHAMEEGWGIDKAAAEIRQHRDQVEDYRAQRIARTETNAAQNRAKHEMMVINDVDYEQWWTAEDDRVRGLDEDDEFDHVAMHGQIVRVMESFVHPTQHWEIPQPGDYYGDAGNVINCRCTVVPYIPPADKEKVVHNLIEQHGQIYPEDIEGAVVQDLSFEMTQEEWEKYLSEEERQSIRDFTDDHYRAIRNAQKGRTEFIEEGTKERIRNIKSALKDAPNHEGEVYRGLRKMTLEDIQRMKGADQITLDAFASTSEHYRQAQHFTEEPSNSMMLQIQSKTGTNIQNLSEYPGEMEILMDEGTAFDVMGHHLDEDGITVLELEEVI